MQKSYVVIVNLLCGMLFVFSNAWAWSVDTHKLLTGAAVRSSVLNDVSGRYLDINLGFEKGLKQSLRWGRYNLTVDFWLEEGSLKEDTFPRYFNHFHNPLKDWAEAGLDDWFVVPTKGMSSLLWAHRDSNDWSWRRIRDYYYQALTASSEDQRHEMFARTFRGLGHQMHLIQDKAVPAHVRNSAHPLEGLVIRNEYGGFFFEAWAKKKKTTVQSFAQKPALPTVDLYQDIADVFRNDRFGNSERFVLSPIVLLTDTNTYDGSYPSTSLAIGLAEYTNANFMSDYTIFSAESRSPGHRHFFPYPKASDTNLQAFIDDQLLPLTRPYRKSCQVPHPQGKKPWGASLNHHLLHLFYQGMSANLENLAVLTAHATTFEHDQETKT